MARPSAALGVAPGQRRDLQRSRVSLRLDMRPERYKKLASLAAWGDGQRPASLIATIEKLIENAPEQLAASQPGFAELFAAARK